MHKLLTNNPRGAQILNLTTGKLRKLEMGSYRWLNSTRPPENLPLLPSSKNWHKMWSLIIWNRRSQKCVATVIFKTWIQCINEPFHFNLIICFLGFYHDLRQQRFPIYFFRSSLSLPSGSYYSPHILISHLWRQRFTTTPVLHRVYSHSMQTSTGIWFIEEKHKTVFTV